MREYLAANVDSGVLKEKLADQLVWLKYQIDHYAETENIEMLEENYNWVVSNFNHDLRLQEQEQFPYL